MGKYLYIKRLAGGVLCGVMVTGIFATHAAEPPVRRVSRVVVSLPDQAFAAYAGDQLVMRGPVSTGKNGSTRPGTFSVSNKHQHWISTLYHVPMPYFMRLNGSAIGLHAGFLPGYPASHGCIRMLRSDAQRLFSMTSVGTRVSIVGTSTMMTAQVQQPSLEDQGVRIVRVVNGENESVSSAYAHNGERISRQRRFSEGRDQRRAMRGAQRPVQLAKN